jgi:hypothetical protein
MGLVLHAPFSRSHLRPQHARQELRVKRGTFEVDERGRGNAAHGGAQPERQKGISQPAARA